MVFLAALRGAQTILTPTDNFLNCTKQRLQHVLLWPSDCKMTHHNYTKNDSDVIWCHSLHSSDQGVEQANWSLIHTPTRPNCKSVTAVNHARHHLGEDFIWYLLICLSHVPSTNMERLNDVCSQDQWGIEMSWPHFFGAVILSILQSLLWPSSSVQSWALNPHRLVTCMINECRDCSQLWGSEGWESTLWKHSTQTY